MEWTAGHPVWGHRQASGPDRLSAGRDGGPELERDRFRGTENNAPCGADQERDRTYRPAFRSCLEYPRDTEAHPQPAFCLRLGRQWVHRLEQVKGEAQYGRGVREA